jgi:hypothetical protein
MDRVPLDGQRYLPWMKTALTAVLVACVTLFVYGSLRWPLVNDVSLMHYISFLMDRGLVPYRDFSDMNLPGSFLIDWLAVHTFGGTALASRIFDLTLMAVASIAIVVIARPYGRFAGVFAASMLILFHGRDGMGQLSQRDMTLAVLLLLAYAFLFHALRAGGIWAMALFGMSAGMATMIKPTAAAYAAVLLGMAAVTLRRRGCAVSARLIAALVGFAVPMAAVWGWLWHMGALAAFWDSISQVTPYYFSLGRRSFAYLAEMCLSPSLQLLGALAAVVAWKRRSWRTWEGSALIAGVALGMAAYVLQAKAYAYHRYPLVALLLTWVGIELASALQDRGVLRMVGVVGLVCATVVLAPLYLRTAMRAQWSEGMIAALESDLTALGGAKLSGEVQCIDSISGCGAAMYEMRLMPAAGLLSDFLVFGPAEKEVVRASRERFWREMEARSPQVIVVTSWLHLLNVGDYGKLEMWPEFAAYLQTNYELRDERSFPAVMTGPQGYRVYVRKATAGKIASF